MDDGQTKDAKPASLLFAAVFVLILLLVPALVLSPPGVLLDLPEFYTAARLLCQGEYIAIYNASAFMARETALFPGGAANVIYLPPFAIFSLAPFGLIPAGAIKIVWWCLLLASVFASLLILKSAYNLPHPVLVRVGAYVAAFGAEWETIKHGQIGPFLLLFLSLTVLFVRRGRPVLAGICLGMIALKPQFLLPLLAFLLGARQFKLIAGALVAPIGLGLTALATGGTAFYSAYSQLMNHSLEMRNWMVPEAGPTLRGQLLRFAPTADATVLAVSSAVLIAMLAFLLWLGDRNKTNPEWHLSWLIASLPLGIVASLHCHNYDLILLLPALFALIVHGAFADWRKPVCLVVLASGCLFLIPIYETLQYDYLLHGGVVNPFFCCLLILAATLATYVFPSPGLRKDVQ